MGYLLGVVLGDDESVSLREWENVHERKYVLRFVDLEARHGAKHHLAKETIVIKM